MSPSESQGDGASACREGPAHRPPDRAGPPAAPRLHVAASFLWLALLALWWWPAGLEFRADDYLALAYGADPRNVLHDFVGPYQNAVRVALFHRPLITLSVALDGWLGGGEPFFPHLMNVVVHLANAALILLLLRRFLPAWSALAAAIFWSFHPGHTQAVSWMIGRVDTHASLFYLACLLFECRRLEGRQRSRLPGLVAFMLGGLTKELCLTLPGALSVLYLSYRSGQRSLPGPWYERIRAVLRDLVPYLWVLCVLLFGRWSFLGEVIGGYAVAEPAPLAALEFWQPLWPEHPTWILLLLCPALFLVVVGCCRRFRAAAALVVLFVVAALPASGAHGTTRVERYLYLPSAASAGLAGLAGPLAPLLLLGSAAVAGWNQRREVRDLGQLVRAVRADVERKLAATLPADDPLLVEAPGSAHGHPLFTIGTDRLAVSPFGPGGRVVLPARPVFPEIAEQRARFEPGSATARYTGPAVLDGRTLFAQLEEATAWLALEGCPGSEFRVMVATSNGWFWVRAAAQAGRLSVKDLLFAVPTGLPPQPDKNLLLDLWPSLETSLDPRPFLYLEARDARGNVLGRSARPIRLPLTRDIGLGLVAKRPNTWILLVLLAGVVAASWWARRAD